MRNKYFFTSISAIAMVASVICFKTTVVASDVSESAFSTAKNIEPSSCGRIVSMAPSITEMIFSLGLGNKVVGVTRYCSYPPEAQTKEKVGGYYDPNYEVIYSLRPDMVFMLPEHEKAEKRLTSLGISKTILRNSGVKDILDSLEKIGGVCGRKSEAGKIKAELLARIDVVRKRVEKLDRPSVMISVGRYMGSETLEDVYISGKDGFYSELIEVAGGKNVYDGPTMQFPAVSVEGILRMNPQVIIDMVPEPEKMGMDESRILGEWNSLKSVDAIINKRVHIFTESYVVVPSLRFIHLLEHMASVIHPEIDWGKH